MHLRRAILLFAVVLVVSALAASLAAPPERDEKKPTSEQPVRRAPDRKGSPLLRARLGRKTRVPAGRHVELTVPVEEPGQVQIEGLGQVRAGQPGTPAVFDLLPPPGSYSVTLTPAGGKPRRVGTLVVERPT